MSREVKKVVKKMTKLKLKMKEHNVCLKTRVRWTPDLHEAFLRAINELQRLQKTVSPIAIMRLMNNDPANTSVAGKKKFQLTRVHVASHLQKYRSDMKCKQFAVGLPLPDFLVPPPRRGRGNSKASLNATKTEEDPDSEDELVDEEEEEEEELQEEVEQVPQKKQLPLEQPQPKKDIKTEQKSPPTNRSPFADSSFDSTMASPSPVREVVLGQPFVAFVEQDYYPQPSFYSVTPNDNQYYDQSYGNSYSDDSFTFDLGECHYNPKALSASYNGYPTQSHYSFFSGPAAWHYPQYTQVTTSSSSVNVTPSPPTSFTHPSWSTGSQCCNACASRSL